MAVFDLAISRHFILPKACKIIIRNLNLFLYNLQECIHFTPSIIPITACFVALSQRNGALVENEVHVARGLSIEVHIFVRPVRVYRRRCFDDLNVEAAGKGLEIGHDELTILFDVRGWQVVGELGESEGNEDADDIGIVAEVQVYVLIYGERDGVVV